MTEPVLMPVADATDDAPDMVAEGGGLRGGRCRSCGAGSFPQAYICPTCNATDIEPAVLPATGSLYSWTTVHVSATFPTPYSLGYVDLADGQRVLGQLVADPADLACDLPVEVVSTDTSPTGWGFRPVEGASA